MKRYFRQTICFLMSLVISSSAGLISLADENHISIVCDEETNLYRVSGRIEEAKVTNIVSIEVVSGEECFYAETLYTNQWGEFYAEFFMPETAISGEYVLKCASLNSDSPYEEVFSHTQKAKYSGVKIYENAYKGVYDRSSAGFGVYMCNPTESKEYRIMYSFDDWANTTSVTAFVPAGKRVTKWIDLSFLENGIYTLRRKVVDETEKVVISETVQHMTVINYYRPKTMDSISRIGMGVNLYEHNSEASDVMLSYLELLGIKNVRIGQGVGFTWENIETQEGVYDFSAMNENYLERLKENGVSIMGAIGGHKFYGENGIVSDENIDAYNAFVKALVENIPNLDSLEVWNEPDISPYLADKIDDYVRLAKNAGITADAVDTDVEIISGAVSSGGYGYNERIFEKGMYPYVEGYSIHPYLHDTRKAGLFANVDASDSGYDYRNWIKNYQFPVEEGHGGWLKKYVSEIGWPTSDISEISVDDQAENLVKTFVYNDYLGIDKGYWYNLRDNGMDSKNNEHMFGIITGANKPKPAFLALSQLTNTLNNGVYLGRYGTGNEVYVYEVDGEIIILAWTISGKTNMTFDSAVSVYDMFGNQVQQSSKTNATTNTVELSSSPVYIKGAGLSYAVEAVKNEVKNSDAKWYLSDITSGLGNGNITEYDVALLIEKCLVKGTDIINSALSNTKKAELLWSVYNVAERLGALYISLSDAYEEYENAELSSSEKIDGVITKRAEKDERKGFTLTYTDKIIGFAKDMNKLSIAYADAKQKAGAVAYDMIANGLCAWAELFMNKENISNIMLKNPELKVKFKGFSNSENGNIIADFEINNTGNFKTNNILFIGAYNGDELRGVDMKEISVTGWENVNIEYTKEQGETVKAMIWDSVQNMKPLLPAEIMRAN